MRKINVFYHERKLLKQKDGIVSKISFIYLLHHAPSSPISPIACCRFIKYYSSSKTKSFINSQQLHNLQSSPLTHKNLFQIRSNYYSLTDIVYINFCFLFQFLLFLYIFLIAEVNSSFLCLLCFVDVLLRFLKQSC